MRFFAPNLPSGGNDPRYTFLRQHVGRELVGTANAPAAALNDILPFEALHRRFQNSHPQVRQLVHPSRFFDCNLPDLQLYVPLKVSGLSGSCEDRKPRDELTELLCDLNVSRDRYGVLLVTRSGGGKTVAARKAFADCVCSPRNVFADGACSAARLSEFVPAWVRIAGQLGDDTDHVIERLLLRAAFQREPTIELIQRLKNDWLKRGPKLLLFFDLNAANQRERELVAEALVDFQNHYGEHGHRCVVSYRSTQSDGVESTLCNEEIDAFRKYDLEPIRPKSALQYVRNIHAFEQEICGHLKVPLPKYDHDAVEEKLGELLKRFEYQHESFISTPLIMHFTASLDSKRLKQVETLTDLYDQVVEQHFDREWKKFCLWKSARHSNVNWKNKSQMCDRVLIAMVRVALRMLAEGATSTDLAESKVLAVWCNPGAGKPGMVGGGAAQSWWPTDEYWHCSAYFQSEFGGSNFKFSESECLALTEFSLLRREFREDGTPDRVVASLRFLHDSLLYYFAAYALRHWQAPAKSALENITGLDEKWFEHAAERMNESPAVWKWPAEFLGGSLDVLQLEELALPMVAAEPKDGWPADFVHLLRGALPRTSKVLHALRWSTGRHGSWIHESGQAYGLPQDVYNFMAFLPEMAEGPCRTFAQRLLTRLRRRTQQFHSFAWIRQINAPPSEFVMTMSEHAGSVTCIASTEDGRIVSGSDDKTVKVWNVITGNVTTLRHENKVSCVAVYPDGRVVSGSDDGRMRVWDPVQDPFGEDVLTIARHTSPISCVAAFPDGRIVSGSYYSVKVGNPVQDPLQKQILWFADRVYSVAVHTDNRIVLGSYDKRVKVWDPVKDPHGNWVQTLAQHTARVACVAVLPDGRVVSGSFDKTVKVWDPVRDPDGNKVLTLTHTDEVKCIAVLPDGRVVSGSFDTTVKVWDPVKDPSRGRIVTFAQHTGWVRSLAALPNSCIVSGSDDKTVKVWDATPDPQDESVLTFARHLNCVSSVAVLPDGQVVSGSWDKTVKVWDPVKDPQGERILTFDRRIGQITFVAALHNGRVVMGHDETVDIWDPTQGESVVTFVRQESRITCVAVLRDRYFVSGGDDGRLFVWDPEGKPLRQHTQHLKTVTSVAVLHDGRVVSGSSDATVKIWDPMQDPHGARVVTLAQHNGWVNTVAVLCEDCVVLGSSDGAVKVWDPTRGRDVRNVLTMAKHNGSVNSICVLHDGRVASGSSDATVKVWDPVRDPHGQRVATIRCGAPVLGVARWADAPRIAVGLSNGYVSVLEVESGVSVERPNN